MSLTEILPTELLERSCIKILPGASFGDLVQRPGEESSDLVRRSFKENLSKDLTLRSLTEIFYFRRSIDCLNRDLTLPDPLQRFSAEISDRHLVQIALHRDLAQQLLQRTCQGDLAHDLLQRSSQRELAESYLVSLLFTTRVALVLLACSH